MSSLNISPSTEVRAILEHPMPNALNGKWSWFSAGYNSGIWKGVLMSHGIPFETVAAKVWKTDMQLIKAGKEGSRELAQQLLPQTNSQLKYVTNILLLCTATSIMSLQRMICMRHRLVAILDAEYQQTTICVSIAHALCVVAHAALAMYGHGKQMRYSLQLHRSGAS